MTGGTRTWKVETQGRALVAGVGRGKGRAAKAFVLALAVALVAGLTWALARAHLAAKGRGRR